MGTARAKWEQLELVDHLRRFLHRPDSYLRHHRHSNDLANAVGVHLPQGRVTATEGHQINNILMERA